MKLFRVLQPGPRTTIQDSGRQHYQRHGLAQGGAADRFAFLSCNKLLDNDLNDACLEMTLGGLSMEALANVSIAIAGADCQATINGVFAPAWQSYALRAGDRLSFSTPGTGRHTYLAVKGGLRSAHKFDSQSVVVREQIAGLSALEEGDSLVGVSQQPRLARYVPEELIPAYDAPLTMGVVPGYQFERFSSTDRARFVTSTYQLSSQSDRMGYRLENGTLGSPPEGIVSEGIAFGAVQVPGDGNPVILLQDRQTIGGYPKLGSLCAVDCYRLAQARPGQSIGFRWIDISEAQSARVLFEERFRRSRWTSQGDLVWS
ncbi:biotin-dependent carboxyltransferase family protein [Marinobacter sp. chi1]|uniref:Biotin-dependent carboxyltransferase family protein n=1 Tax=Marinobacter suaedae TaxID=3057675 RepID=A0ABT8W2A2_9GAMM|nr:biotin-dependent carboxyltransferase family protein [Marinobacter sp. chi1]MDO3722288.1 biotin-dependent carboxyltransferase family protein [Marinobacter sp. chi1]